MNWQHMMYFKAVAKIQNYSRAAEELYITTSALSKAIHNLEGELGFPLFRKSGRNSQLTSHGAAFYQCVCEASALIEQGLQAIHQEMNVVSGNIRVHGIYTMCVEYLPHQIRQFRSQYPNVTFSMEYRTTNIILKELLEGVIDLGFCGNFDCQAKQYEGLGHILLREEELIILVPESHPLAQESQIPFEELRGEAFIVHKHRTTGTGSVFLQLCNKYSFAPNIAFEVPDDQSIMGLVRTGLGIALIADSPSLKLDGTKTVRLSGDFPVRNQYMIWRKERFLSPVASAFRDQILSSPEFE